MRELAARCECPRCGYDQAGAIAAWGRNEPAYCPLMGTCSECGLGFEWGNLFSAIEAAQRGIFEHAKQRHTTALIGTLYRSLWPNSFWRWIAMEHRIRVRRVIVCLAVCACLVYLATGVLSLGWDLLRAWRPLGTSLVRYSPGRPLATADQRFTFWWHHEVQPYWWCLGPRNSGEPAVAPVIAVSLVAMALMPLSYLLLPITFRSMRVRRLHLFRITAYGWIWVPLFLWAGQGLVEQTRSGAWARPFSTRTVSVEWRYVAAACFLWQVWWWSAATRYYLKAPRPATISFTLAVVCYLTGFVLLFVLWGGGHMLYGV
jgi:hypothetical protein